MYRMYVTDALRVGYDLNMRYADMIREGKVVQESPEEIKARIKGKIRKLGN